MTLFWEWLTGLAILGFIGAVINLNGPAIVGALILVALCLWHWTKRGWA